MNPGFASSNFTCQVKLISGSFSKLVFPLNLSWNTRLPGDPVVKENTEVTEPSLFAIATPATLFPLNVGSLGPLRLRLPGSAK